MTDFAEISGEIDDLAGEEPAAARKALGKYAVRDQVAVLATHEAGGGGSQPITRGVYGYNPVTIAGNGSGFAKFGALGAGGTALLDLTDPTKPLIVTAGTYAISLVVSNDDDFTAGDFFSAGLDLDVDGGDNAASVADRRVATTNVLGLKMPLGMTWYLPAGAAIQVDISNGSADPHDYAIVPTNIQRLS